MASSFGINVNQEEKDLHPIFKTNPTLLWNYVNKKVHLTSQEGLLFQGWVYTIDPVTHSWVLFSDEALMDPRIHLVMNASVISAEIVNEVCPENILHMMSRYGEAEKVELDEVALVRRRDAVCRWFSVNRIPVSKVSKSLSVANGVLSIEPPYLPENCCSSNEIILARIRTLLRSMPKSDNMDT